MTLLTYHETVLTVDAYPKTIHNTEPKEGFD